MLRIWSCHDNHGGCVDVSRWLLRKYLQFDRLRFELLDEHLLRFGVPLCALQVLSAMLAQMDVGVHPNHTCLLELHANSATPRSIDRMRLSLGDPGSAVYLAPFLNQRSSNCRCLDEPGLRGSWSAWQCVACIGPDADDDDAKAVVDTDMRSAFSASHALEHASPSQTRTNPFLEQGAFSRMRTDMDTHPGNAFLPSRSPVAGASQVLRDDSHSFADGASSSAAGASHAPYAGSHSSAHGASHALPMQRFGSHSSAAGASHAPHAVSHPSADGTAHPSYDGASLCPLRITLSTTPRTPLSPTPTTTMPRPLCPLRRSTSIHAAFAGGLRL